MNWLPVVALTYILVSAALVMVLARWFQRGLEIAHASGRLQRRPAWQALAIVIFLLVIGVGMFVWVGLSIGNGEVTTGRHQVHVVRLAESPGAFWLEIAMRYVAALIVTAVTPSASYRIRR